MPGFRAKTWLYSCSAISYSWLKLLVKMDTDKAQSALLLSALTIIADFLLNVKLLDLNPKGAPNRFLCLNQLVNSKALCNIARKPLYTKILSSDCRIGKTQQIKDLETGMQVVPKGSPIFSPIIWLTSTNIHKQSYTKNRFYKLVGCPNRYRLNLAASALPDIKEEEEAIWLKLEYNINRDDLEVKKLLLSFYASRVIVNEAYFAKSPKSILN
ncbi:unnamed protein product [Fusarium fujikuroi]|uniref:Uncharacterized protein n=1 Tax=Fusarium fujikuroi TaxID=5127 RepID=A0A9Q9RAJ9_FUSFU|nr:unnamed protein product [Fusarium fujikuroi]